MTMARTIKLYKLPATPVTPGLRPMLRSDAPAVAALLNGYLGLFRLAQRFSVEEVEHWWGPQGLFSLGRGGAKGGTDGAASLCWGTERRRQPPRPSVRASRFPAPGSLACGALGLPPLPKRRHPPPWN